jgi:hypothetical protein
MKPVAIDVLLEQHKAESRSVFWFGFFAAADFLGYSASQPGE